jgi:alpha-L-fucosidase
VRNLIACARDTGNYLLNIGPKPDGGIPEESVKALTAVGKWMEKSGKSIYDTDVCQPRRSNYASFTRKGNTLYMHVYFWPGETVALAGLMNQVKSARLLATGKDVKFEQDKFRVRFTGLPEKAPDDPVTTLAIECDGEPKQDTDFVRKERPRLKA